MENFGPGIKTSASNSKTSSKVARMQALVSAQTSAPILERASEALTKVAPISEYFGCNTFGLSHMREKLPKDAYASLLLTLEKGKKLPKEAAEAIASAVKEWAVNKGATHFCHWFQPMTGSTAEKHDAFVSIQHSQHSELRVIERFTGSQLIQGEPDASSFPSGGMRSTFEARGYTAWDPSSPLFLLEEGNSKTLCIPTVFFGYHGQALDNKTPLLRSVEILSQEACEFLKLLGDSDVKRVSVTLGAEQEYFLIDKSFVALRPDLVLTGRTLLGAPSARGQQLEDHYFGSIPSRIARFMHEVEFELYKLGVPVKTRHNEVAPSQFELAPIFEDVNIASDHNLLTMEILRKVAARHGLACLLHEKPFAGINGSGKHNNWSLSTDQGENLLEPGQTPHENLRFLAVLAVILKAVLEHADVLRLSIASPGNDHRLGANEAPPAIISVFLGSLLEDILEDIESGKALKATEQQIIDLGISKIPAVSKDYTDRNRTSPFAFTGNKFEFRAVGSSQNCAVPMSVLNAAVAASFRESGARLKKLREEKNQREPAIMELIRQLVVETKAIRFSGNGYSQEWRKEAKKRKLPILNNTPEALSVFAEKKSMEFLLKTKVFSEEEIESRHHIAIERYIKTLEIELLTLQDMLRTLVLPALYQHLGQLDQATRSCSKTSLKKRLKREQQSFESRLEKILQSLDQFNSLLEKFKKAPNEKSQMQQLWQDLVPKSQDLRAAVDEAELVVADDLWPLPKYREMLLSHGV